MSILESFVSKAAQDHKRILEVYEAIETAAATKLQNLGTLHYLQVDFSLVNKIVMKLPVPKQTKYTDYITSEAVKTSPSTRWDEFWNFCWGRYLSMVGIMLHL